jgi:hypothetical protein
MWKLDITPKPKAVKDHYDAYMALINELVDKYLADTNSRLGSVPERDASDRREPDATPERASGPVGNGNPNDPAWD